MRVVRRRLFWKIYITLLASLVVTAMVMSTFFWFLAETQRENFPQTSTDSPTVTKPWPRAVSLYDSDDKLVGARGRTIAPAEHVTGRRWGPGHVVRIDLPNGQYVLTRFGPPPDTRARRILAIMLIVAGAVGLAAYPVTALLTRRLETLRRGVAEWGQHAVPVKVDERGSDEVALLARTFNSAAARLDTMLTSQKALLANASHELRSPLARLRLAVEVAGTERSSATNTEIVTNLAEMDQLVDELLLSSRLDHMQLDNDRREPVDLLGLAAEEAARCNAVAVGVPVEISGDAVLLRRLMRNLLENATRHGRPTVTIAVSQVPGGAEVIVSDEGEGIPIEELDRIFEPFYRPSESKESAGGWGLGLALVRQIAERHGGSAECRATSEGASCFVIRLASE